MSNKSLVFLILSLVFLASSLAWSQEVDEKPQQQDEEAKKKFVLEKLTEQLRFAFRSKALLKVDDLERFAGLEPGGLFKARVLAKGAIREISKSFDTRISGAIARSIREIAGTTFSINGKEFTFNGEDPEKPFLTIRFDFFRKNGQWNVRRPRGGSGGSFGATELPFRIEDDNSWRNGVSPIRDDQLTDYERFVEERANQQLSLAITALLSDSLQLSSSQKEQMREFVSKYAKRDFDYTILENASLYLDDRVLDATPGFLTDIQKHMWSQLIKSD